MIGFSGVLILQLIAVDVVPQLVLVSRFSVIFPGPQDASGKRTAAGKVAWHGGIFCLYLIGSGRGHMWLLSRLCWFPSGLWAKKKATFQSLVDHQPWWRETGNVAFDKTGCAVMGLALQPWGGCHADRFAVGVWHLGKESSKVVGPPCECSVHHSARTIQNVPNSLGNSLP